MVHSVRLRLNWVWIVVIISLFTHISTVSFSDISVLFPLNVHACRPKELLKMQISSTFSNIVIETSLNSDVQNLCPLPGS